MRLLQTDHANRLNCFIEFERVGIDLIDIDVNAKDDHCNETIELEEGEPASEFWTRALHRLEVLRVGRLETLDSLVYATVVLSNRKVRALRNETKARLRTLIQPGAGHPDPEVRLRATLELADMLWPQLIHDQRVQ